MIDREKVIKGLATHLGNKSPQCKECPYFNFVDMRQYNDPNSCLLSVMTDALALLKEQQEIIRCKDCKWGDWSENGKGEKMIFCYNGDTGIEDGYLHKPDWFCADGERR